MRVMFLALALLSSGASATNHLVQVDEIMAGVNGDSQIQFIEIRVADEGQKLWGPNGSEQDGRAMLAFFDIHGNRTGQFVFPGNAPSGGNQVLIATLAFAALPGAPIPDFIIPPQVMAISGKICFRGNVDNPNRFDVNLCLSYGSFGGDTEGAGVPAPEMPIVNAISLRRIRGFDTFAFQSNADFEMATPAPTNTRGLTANFAAAPQVDQGRNLFFKEKFIGNGRTCGTCHVAGDGFGLTPERVAALPLSDPIFIADINPDLNGLENPALLRGRRALILENIDGFNNPPVMRASPHLLNIALTAPYGLSGEIPDLQTFIRRAVRQHFPRRLDRVETVDFRLPTLAEGQAMEAFMRSIFLPSDGGFDLDLFVTTDQQRRGRDLFFGQAKCGTCHSGPVLAHSDGSFGTMAGVNQAFNTGVADLLINDALPREPATSSTNTRAFSVPTLFGVADTGPYFHDNSVLTLREAVQFYDSREFVNSPAGQQVGPIDLTDPQTVDDLLAFLASTPEVITGPDFPSETPRPDDPPGPSETLCFGLQVTIMGTDGPDRLTGTSGMDIIAGLGGNDRINGRGGNDLLCGGKGKDRISGGPGRDKLDGGSGADRCIGGPGRDRARKCER